MGTCRLDGTKLYKNRALKNYFCENKFLRAAATNSVIEFYDMTENGVLFWLVYMDFNLFIYCFSTVAQIPSLK